MIQNVVTHLITSMIKQNGNSSQIKWKRIRKQSYMDCFEVFERCYLKNILLHYNVKKHLSFKSTLRFDKELHSKNLNVVTRYNEYCLWNIIVIPRIYKEKQLKLNYKKPWPSSDRYLVTWNKKSNRFK